MRNENVHPPKPIVGIIGAGKLARGLTTYWDQKGFVLSYCYNRTEEHAEGIAKQTGAVQTRTAKELFNQCDWIWIAISDQGIQSFCDDIADLYAHSTDEKANPLEGKLICHTSGALTSEVLNRLKKLGGACCSLHPLQAFSNHAFSNGALENTWFFVEGDLGVLHQKWISDYFAQTKNPYREIQKQDKPLYHAAACTASNYLMTLMDEAARLLALCGDEIPFEALLPLVYGSLENYKESGFKALTGPISRGDANTVDLHLKTMKSHCHTTHFYQWMGLETINAMKKSEMLDAEIHQNVIAALSSEEA